MSGLRRARGVARFGLAGVQLWLGAATAYLLGLLIASRRAPRASPAGTRAAEGAPLRFVTLVPAHDEAERIAATVEALAAQDHPADARETIVIADNCTDETARVAREAGATVWERADADARGKGQALAWALERVWVERPETEAIAMVDGDCLPTPNLISACDAHLRAGARAVQADYVVSNAEASASSALRYAGFALMHSVRPRGKHVIGFSCGLFGTGMAFTAELLREHPWTSFSITEDAEYHLRLIEAGVVVDYVGEAAVHTLMPTTDAGAREQQLRWESGNAALTATVPRLLRDGLTRRDPQRLHAGVERLVPPQSLLLAGNAAAGLAALVLWPRRLLAPAILTGLAQAGYVLGGLAAAGAPREVFLALLDAPRLVAAKLPLFGRIFSGRGATDWERTQREPESSPSAPADA